jgi:hypothetical protein
MYIIIYNEEKKRLELEYTDISYSLSITSLYLTINSYLNFSIFT